MTGLSVLKCEEKYRLDKVPTFTPMKPAIISVSCSLCAANLFALTASDDASNYGIWTDTQNQGTGFLDWSLSSSGGTSGFAGHLIGDSTSGAGDINTGSNQSFSMFADSDSGAFSTAIRSFGTALSVNDVFSFKMGINFDNGNKGFNIRTAGDSIFNFNIGGGGSVSSANATLNAGAGAGYDYGGSDAMLDAVIRVIGADTIEYEISRVSSSGFQGVLFSGSVSNILNPIDNFEFYVSGTDDGQDANNFYFNSLSVSEVPEPSASAFLVGVLVLAFAARRRR